MNGKSWIILSVSIFVLALAIIPFVFMIIYNTKKKWNIKRFEINKSLSILGSCLCAVWVFLIWIIYYL